MKTGFAADEGNDVIVSQGDVAFYLTLPFLRWPHHVAAVLCVGAVKLDRMRAEGDHPRLYALGRAIYTTQSDLRDWMEAHEVPSGFKACAGGSGRPRKEQTK